MEALSSIESFVRSAEAGSFSAAARRLGITPAAVSKNVAQLEKRLGVRLFQRSTRSLALTEAGERFLADVAGGLSTIQSAIAKLAEADGQPSGTLKVSLAPSFGRDYILPLLGDFLTRYPAVLPDWHFDNRQVDLIGEGFDAAIGGGIELSPGVVARQLARLHLVPVASPAYFAGKPIPTTPDELAQYPGILWRSPQTGRVRPWLLHGPEGVQASIELPTRATLSDPEALCHSALLGLGVALVGMPHALPHLRSGTLVRALPGWHADAGAISLYFAGQKLLPAKTRVFVDFVAARFRELRWADELAAG